MVLGLSGVGAIDYMYNHRLSAKQAGRLTDEHRIVLAGAIMCARRRAQGSPTADKKAVSMLADVMVFAPILSEGMEGEGVDALRKALGRHPDATDVIHGVEKSGSMLAL